jgi:hypothetical protein
MNLNQWKALPSEEQERLVDSLDVSPYTHMSLLQEVEAEFVLQFGSQPPVGSVRCSLGPGLGPYNAITVEIIPGKGRSKLPKRFLKAIEATS